jgi:hypothetical protein
MFTGRPAAMQSMPSSKFPQTHPLPPATAPLAYDAELAQETKVRH